MAITDADRCVLWEHLGTLDWCEWCSERVATWSCGNSCCDECLSKARADVAKREDASAFHEKHNAKQLRALIRVAHGMEIEWTDGGDLSSAIAGLYNLRAVKYGDFEPRQWAATVGRYCGPPEQHIVKCLDTRDAAKAACEQYVREREELVALRVRVKELEAKLNPPKRVCGDRCDCWSCVSYR
jgi:hypothetical protein